VVREQMSAKLNELILEKDSASHPGTKAYLKLVQGCLTELVDGLGKQKRAEFDDIAALQNTVGVDADLKAKWVHLSILRFSHVFNFILYLQTS
jgi:hypothetical protein